ncbi:MAG: nickel-dependent lactate racemase [Thermodesulfobacteriota bacterium]
MQIDLPWGHETLHLNVPDTWALVFPQNKPMMNAILSDETAIVRAALESPVDSQRLRDVDLGEKHILIVVDDNTRPTPVSRFLHLILEELRSAGTDSSRITLMPALGIHSPMSPAEMSAKVGAENLAKLHWRNHNAFNEAEMKHFGTTRRGTPVILNRAVADADWIILVGLIEPHLWAGFGGGLKNIFPGLASAAAIGAHHEIIAEPPYRFNRVGMEPEDNSFRQDLEEIAGFIPARIYCVNVALDHQGSISAAFAGDPVAAHRQGVRFNKQTAGRYLQKAVDAVIVNSYPMDINFKQSMKGVANSLPALTAGGTVMAFLRAERGLDDITPPADAKPLWLVKGILRLLGAPRIMWFLEKIRPGLNVEEKFLLYYSLQLVRQYELYFHVPTLTEKTVRQLGFFKNFSEPQAVIDHAAKKLKRNAAVAVFTEAGATFPVIETV